MSHRAAALSVIAGIGAACSMVLDGDGRIFRAMTARVVQPGTPA